MLDGAGLPVSYGSTVYSSTDTAGAPSPAATSGLALSPILWFGLCTLTYPICGSSWILFNSILAFSNIVNDPDTISISTSFGTTSGAALSR